MGIKKKILFCKIFKKFICNQFFYWTFQQYMWILYNPLKIQTIIVYLNEIIKAAKPSKEKQEHWMKLTRLNEVYAVSFF